MDQEEMHMHLEEYKDNPSKVLVDFDETSKLGKVLINLTKLQLYTESELQSTFATLDLKRYKHSNPSIILRKIVDEKKGLLGYVIWTGSKVVEVPVNKIETLKDKYFVNAKIVKVEGRRYYISPLKGDFEEIKVDSISLKTEAEIERIITFNLKHGIIKISRDDFRIKEVEPLLEVYEERGNKMNYETMLKFILDSKADNQIYEIRLYEDNKKIGLPLEQHFSCDKHLLEEDAEQWITELTHSSHLTDIEDRMELHEL